MCKYCGKWPAGLFPLTVAVVLVLSDRLDLPGGRSITIANPLLYYTRTYTIYSTVRTYTYITHTHHTASHANTHTRGPFHSTHLHISLRRYKHTYTRYEGVSGGGKTRERRERGEHELERNGDRDGKGV